LRLLLLLLHGVRLLLCCHSILLLHIGHSLAILHSWCAKQAAGMAAGCVEASAKSHSKI
jgi:hypothetical protein